MKRILLMFAVLLIASCEQSPIVEQSMLNQPEEFWATFEGVDESDTRTYLDDQARMRWTADDRLTIFKKTTYNREFAFTGKTGANAGGFKQVSVDDDFWFGYDVDYNYAIYPHSAANEFDETNCFFTTTMPAEQTYVENSFGLGANTMVAVSESGQLIFKNVGSYLRVMLWGENQTVKKIMLNSIAGEALAGEAKIFATLADAPTCTMIDDISSITLTCETPVEINATEEEPVAFWIVVPPVVLSEGYTVTVENAEGETQTYEVNKEKTFKRNVYNTLRRELTIGVVEEPTIPANNEIWYTTTNGAVLYLYSENSYDDFGATIVSNTYENGKGVIKFDGDVTNLYLNGDDAIETITFPASVKDGYIRYCRYLKQFVGHLASEDGRCFVVDGVVNGFAPSGLTEYTFPQGITKIGGEEINGSSYYAEVLGATSSIMKFVIPEGVTEIGYYAFGERLNNGAQSGLVVELPSTLTTIGAWSIVAAGLEEITLPANVKTIGEYAFCGNFELTTVYCKAVTPPTDPDPDGRYNWFADDTKLTKIYVPAESVAAYKAAEGWSEYADVIVGYDFEKGEIVEEETTKQPNNEIWYTTTDGNIITSSSGANFYKAISNTYENGKGVIVFDGDVKSISSRMFYSIKNLESVIIPDGVTSIGMQSFASCTSLKSATIGKSVTLIDEDAFYNCHKLLDIYCKPTTPPSLENVGVFTNTYTQRNFYVPTASVNAYKSDLDWSSFSSMIKGYDFAE